MKKQELLDSIDAIGRPVPRFGNLRAVNESLFEIREWDAANPTEAANHRALCDEVDRVEAAELEAERSTRRAERITAAIDSSGAGTRSLEAATAPKNTQALAATRAWLSDPKQWALVLRGDVGTGKTVAACWALKTVAKQAETVAFRRGGEIVRLSGFDEGARELSRLKAAGLLVIDDIGAEQLTDWGRSLLSELLDTRCEGRLRTVLTANPTWDELVKRLGSRIVDRLRDGGRVVELSGESMRQRSA